MNSAKNFVKKLIGKAISIPSNYLIAALIITFGCLFSQILGLSGCLDNINNVMTPHIHNIKEKVVEAATCERTGKIVNFCSDCNFSEEEVAPILEHEWDIQSISKYATCTESGEISCVCLLCQKTEERKWPTLGHQFSQQLCQNCPLASVRPNVWYVFSLSDGFCYQNAVVTSTELISYGNIFVTKYHPVCHSCSKAGALRQINIQKYGPPVNVSHSCPYCYTITYARFEVVL